MPKYEKAPFLQQRRKQLESTLPEDRDILNENQIGEGRGEIAGSESSQNLNEQVSEDMRLNNVPVDDTKEGKIALEKDENLEFDIQTSSEGKIKPGPGRPKKESSIVRNICKTTRFDKDTNNRLREVKYNYEFDFQDIVYLAVNEYLDVHFPKGKANKEDLIDITQKMEMLNKKIAKKK